MFCRLPELELFLSLPLTLIAQEGLVRSGVSWAFFGLPSSSHARQTELLYIHSRLPSMEPSTAPMPPLHSIIQTIRWGKETKKGVSDSAAPPNELRPRLCSLWPLDVSCFFLPFPFAHFLL
ncbi:hypothetical protein ABW19_dt0202029 [Dactylella cylindrospora]|nr:hypothetical protein ABW19_dt0202029 [Dactylella cylindrospora]